MNFGMTTLDKSMETEQNFVTQIVIALLFTLITFITYIYINEFLEDISNDAERWFDTSIIKKIKDRFQQVRIKKYHVFLKMNQEGKK